MGLVDDSSSMAQDEAYLEEVLICMLDRARNIRKLVNAVSEDEFYRDQTLGLTITHMLEGLRQDAMEANRLRNSSRPEVPWSSINSFERHLKPTDQGYEYGVIWEIATKHTALLIHDILKILRD